MLFVICCSHHVDVLPATAATRLFVMFILTFLPPGEDVSGGGVLVMFSGLEPQLEGDDPLILKQR